MKGVFTTLIFFVYSLLCISKLSAQVVEDSLTKMSVPIIKMYGEFGKSYSKGSLILVDDTNLLNTDTFSIYAKYRGATALSFQKKSFSFKLVDDLDEKLEVSLLGMRKDNNWILDAMAIDRARMRNRVAFDIWNAMDVKPYYYESEPKARIGIDGRFVEVYINDQYNGIYCLNEKIDRKQLKIKKVKDGTIRGVLYKGCHFLGTDFGDESEVYSDSSSVYQGFESVYPDVDDNGVTEWAPLVDKEDFVVNSTPDVFADEYESQFDVPVLTNLHVLINTIGAMDNSGKNQYFYIYDITNNSMMSFAPWDMDASFGRSWDGTVFDYSYNGLLYERHLVSLMKIVDNRFLIGAAKRYFELRKTILSNDSIKLRFDNYRLLFETSGADQREFNKWNGADGIELNFETEKEFINEYIDFRMAWLDDYYGYYQGLADVRDKVFPESYENIIYDIWGRRVYDLKPRNIYIRNGLPIYFK